MAQGIVNRVVPASAFALGVVRSIVHGTFLISILFTSFSALGSLPATILRPTGVMKFLPWSFYDQLQTPVGMLTSENADGVVAVVEHGRVSDGHLNKDFAAAGGFLPGTAAQLRALQSRRDDRRLFPRGAGIRSAIRESDPVNRT